MTHTWDVKIGRSALPGILSCPNCPKSLVIFAHGGGSSRLSPRNRRAADFLNSLGFATLRFDLLTEKQAEDRRNVFDVGSLAGKVADAIGWARQDERTFLLPIGLFGASTGAAAAILAAAEQPHDIAALVSRGGRPDLAAEALPALQTPTLLIVGENDPQALEMNRSARARLTCESSLVVIPGATHLFEEPGAMDKALEATAHWFDRFLRPPIPHFADRPAAGRLLAAKLTHLNLDRPVVYALPRGGAPVAFEVAKSLNAPLDVAIVRKIGAPGQPELALGAVVDGETPQVVRNEDIISAAGVPDADFFVAAAAQREEIDRRHALYRGARAPVALAGRDAILVDDGLATGASMEAAVLALRRRGPKKLVVAIPVASPEAAIRVRRHADQVVCLAAPESFRAVGAYYDDFHQLSDEEVVALLRAAP